MNTVVIDTNVLLVANGSHEGASPSCQKTCVEHLLERQKNGVIAIDDEYRILGEYQNKTHPNQPKGVGDVFLKWLLQNQGNKSRVHKVTITETTKDIFSEFPDHQLQPEFDAPDRKFAAVANNHPEKPPIWQAVDCKWLNWWPQLADKGVKVNFLCPADVCQFYQSKFPRQPLPRFPQAT